MLLAVQPDQHDLQQALHLRWTNGTPCRLCDSVDASLVGQRLGSFTRISSAVRTALEAALTRILTPKRSIDVLREVCSSCAGLYLVSLACCTFCRDDASHCRRAGLVRRHPMNSTPHQPESMPAVSSGAAQQGMMWQQALDVSGAGCCC